MLCSIVESHIAVNPCNMRTHTRPYFHYTAPKRSINDALHRHTMLTPLRPFLSYASFANESLGVLPCTSVVVRLRRLQQARQLHTVRLVKLRCPRVNLVGSIGPLWDIRASKDSTYTIISSFPPRNKLLITTRVLTKGPVSRSLPVNDSPLNILLIREGEVCEAADEGAGWLECRVSLCVFDFAVWGDVGLLASWDDDTVLC